MSEKLVSVIMPAYNASSYIKESIESVIKQTYQNWELLISDNNSADNTAEIIKSYAEQDSRIKYIKASEKQGAGYARNVAIENAGGSYIAFLDSDDRWLPEKLTKHIKFMEDEDLVLSYTSYQTFGESDSIVKNHGEVDYAKLLHHNVIGCSTAIYNLDKIGDKYYMSTLRIAEDWCLWCNILKDTKSTAKMLDDPLTLYRIDQNSLSANKLKCAYYHYLALRKELKVPLIKSLYLFTCYSLVNLKKMHNRRVFVRMLGIRHK